MTSACSRVVVFFEFFGAQMLSYGITTWNLRAIANLRYDHIAASATILALVNFFVVSKIAKLKVNRTTALFGYMLGGVSGDVLASYLTRSL